LEVREKGNREKRKQYAAMQATDDVHTVSYLAESGHTLTVVLNLATGRMFGFASNNHEWYSMTGGFEAVR
jgi:hypothetical protein